MGNKTTELKLIVELMKNSRKSDRSLAKAINVSQPTVTRLRNKLEKEGIIREYAMIPDFSKLGFEIVSLTFFKFRRELSDKELEKVKKGAREFQEENPIAVLMAARGMGLGFDRLLISFHKNYASYMKTLEAIKHFPEVDITHVESFLVSLTGEEHYQLLSLSTIADYMLTMDKEE